MKLSDETLKQIAQGSGRCYAHEGKAMAQELMDFRHDANLKAMAQTAAGNTPAATGWAPNQIPPPSPTRSNPPVIVPDPSPDQWPTASP